MIRSRTLRTERAASCDPDKPQKSHDTTHVTAISPIIWPRFRRHSEDLRTKRSGFLHLHAVYTSRLFSAVFCFVLIFVLWTVSAVGCGRVSPRPAHSSAAGVIAKSYSCYIAYLHNSKYQYLAKLHAIRISEHDSETET